jgi:class 3 adenylate cyclase
MKIAINQFHRAMSWLYSLGTEGLEGAELRQVNMVAVVSVIPLLTGISFGIMFAVYDLENLALSAQLSILANVPFVLPLILLATGHTLAARVVLILLLTVVVASFTYINSAQAGTPLYHLAIVLVAFLVLGPARWLLMVLFVGLSVALYVYELVSFTEPLAALNFDQKVLETLFVLNAVTVFFLVTLITRIFYNLVVRAEEALRKAHDHEAKFASAVSDYLDPSLVEGLRDGADLEPRVRHLTIFFSDLAGSTRISFAMDQDAYGQMINAYVREMQAIIKEAGAYIEDISGDGILGYFGNFNSRGPTGDALCAVAMAREMQARLSLLVPGFMSAYGLPEDLYMRIGIASGDAMVGKTDGARTIYTANGDVVNLGAKLEKAVKEISTTGGILINEATGRAVDADYSLEEHTMTIEGEALTAFSIQGKS